MKRVLIPQQIAKLRLVSLLMLNLLGGCVSNSGIVGNAVSRSSECGAFEGIFSAYGRRTPEFDVGAPIPGESPSSVDFYNQVFMSEFLGCYPDCGLGMDSRYTAFALKYDSPVLRWAALHSPSGEVVYHGEKSMNCKDGELVYSQKLDVPLFPYPPYAIGESEDFRFMIINTENWLVGYEKHAFKGTVFIVFPTMGSTTDDWAEFPPDTHIKVDIDAIFDSLPEPKGLEVVKVGDPKANDYQKQAEKLEPQRVLLSNDGTGTGTKTIGEISLYLVSVDQEERDDKYYNIFADVIVRRGAVERQLRWPVGDNKDGRLI